MRDICFLIVFRKLEVKLIPGIRNKKIAACYILSGLRRWFWNVYSWNRKAISVVVLQNYLHGNMYKLHNEMTRLNCQIYHVIYFGWNKCSCHITTGACRNTSRHMSTCISPRLNVVVGTRILERVEASVCDILTRLKVNDWFDFCVVILKIYWVMISDCEKKNKVTPITKTW
jgi:hypothetical protein